MVAALLVAERFWTWPGISSADTVLPFLSCPLGGMMQRGTEAGLVPLFHATIFTIPLYCPLFCY